MFRELRRKRQKLERKACIDTLEKCGTGVLSVIGDGGYPYGVPVNYIYLKEEDAIYIHCAKSGHKLDAIENNEKVCFTVIEKDELVPEKLTTYFRSVIAFGKARKVTDESEMKNNAVLFGLKFCNDKDSVEKEVDREFNSLAVIKIKIEHLSGKQAIELV